MSRAVEAPMARDMKPASSEPKALPMLAAMERKLEARPRRASGVKSCVTFWRIMTLKESV